MEKKDVFVFALITIVIIFSLVLFGVYVERSKGQTVSEQLVENEKKEGVSIKESAKELIDDFGVELEKREGVNRKYVGDDEVGVVVNVPRNPLIGGDKVKEKEYNSIVDVLYKFEEDVNYEDGTKYIGLDSQYYKNTEDVIEFLSYFFNEDIKYTSIVNAYYKVEDGVYYVKAQFIQFNYGEEVNVSDFNKVMEFIVNTDNGLIYPSKFIKTEVFNEKISLSDCEIVVKDADFYINELFVNAEINNLTDMDFNFKDRYSLVALTGKMKLDKGFDIYATDFDLRASGVRDMTFKYVYNYSPNITFTIEGRE